MNWTTGICKTNGIDIHYRRTGGSKPSVILLHGLTGNGACWAPLARGLEDKYDVVMPDARGHGRSSCDSKLNYHYDDLATDIESFIDELKLTTPILLGHSMGGMTAALVASRNPKRLRGLILADPTFLTLQRQHEVYKSDVAEQHRRIIRHTKKKYLAEIKSRYRNRSREIIELIVEARFQTSIHAFEILTPPNPDYLTLIQTIDVPSLLVVGDVGSVISPEIATKLSLHNDHIKVAQILQTGHGIPYEQPGRFLETVQTFLNVIMQI